MLKPIPAIERRAKELASWNPSQTYEWAFHQAQAEAAAGTLPDYSPIATAHREVEAAQRDLTAAQNADRYDSAFVSQQFARLLAAKQRYGAALMAESGSPTSLAAE